MHVEDGSDLPNVLALPVIEVQNDALGTGQFFQTFLYQLLKLRSLQYQSREFSSESAT